MRLPFADADISIDSIADSIAPIANEKEWGLIIFLVFVFVFILVAVMKSIKDRDKVTGEREERLINLMLQFGQSVPLLTESINGLRGWLSGRFEEVDKDLDAIKKNQKTSGEKTAVQTVTLASHTKQIKKHDHILSDHNTRIESLEHQEQPEKDESKPDEKKTKKSAEKKAKRTVSGKSK